MNTTLKMVSAALLLTTAACTAEADAPGDEVPSTEESGLTSTTASTSGLEMYIGWEVRAELRDALGRQEDELHFGDVTIPGVLRVQHQYSVAALRLEVASWTLVTHLTPPNVGSWGIDSAIGVSFPSRRDGEESPNAQAAAVAAKRLFTALTHAKESSRTVGAGVVETTRTSAHGSFSCTKTTHTGHPTEFRCLVAGVGNLGSGGLLWDWHTAEAKAAENADAPAPGR